MIVSRFYICAIPEQFWENNIDGFNLCQSVDEALACERRITKDVNLQTEYGRYSLLCQQIEKEIVCSGRMVFVKSTEEFSQAISSYKFAFQRLPVGYLQLLTRANASSLNWRLGRSFFPPAEMDIHLQAYQKWVQNEGLENTQVVKHRLSFFKQAKKNNCGVVEIQSGFLHHAENEGTKDQLESLSSPGEETEEIQNQIPDYTLLGIEIEYFGTKGPKQHYAKNLRKQIQEGLRNNEPVCFGNQATNDVIAEVLHEFVFVPDKNNISQVNLRVVYADGSEAAPFPLACLPICERSNDLVFSLRVALMSMRHLEMDPETDFCWFRNRNVSKSRSLAETDQYCYETTLNQITEFLNSGNLAIKLFQTGFEPAVIGFYRGVVQTMLTMKKRRTEKTISVCPFYYRGVGKPYETGSTW